MGIESNIFCRNKKFAVLQIGARNSYAVPYILFKNKNLKVFYTDLHSNHFIFKFLRLIVPYCLMPIKLKNLLARKLPSNLLKKFVKDLPLFSIIFHSNQKKLSKLILDRALKDKFSGANAIYTNFINCDVEHLKKAKDQGIHIVHEMFISPDSGLIMYEENKRFPEVNIKHERWDDVQKGILLDKKKWEISDQIIVPSKYCKDSAIKMGVEPHKISLVPYGINRDLFNFIPSVQKGKILFVGQLGLRKGAHYFAEASRILRSKGKRYNFVGAGLPRANINHPIFDGITVLGHLPRNEIIYQYLTADVFVLPTLVEGMAIAHLEAMAFGLPIITTPNCGSVISDSREGFIVPIKDSQILASKIEEIVENRDLRNEISYRSKQKAKLYTWEKYSQNLLKAINY